MKTKNRVMKNNLIGLMIMVSVVLVPLISIGMDESPLTPRYKKWLEEEVVYIITPLEKEVFLKLESDQERERFINSFWEKRDPFLLTEQNEFKEEHYRRIGYATREFGRVSPLPGWKTDMGKIHIILGPPISIQRFEDYSFAYPVVVWSYIGMSHPGLPDSFNIVFYKRFGVGDYQLYNPSTDGPESLLAVTGVNFRERFQAYEVLNTYSPHLAQYSLTLIPGESLPRSLHSFESERLLISINSVPHKQVSDEYAAKLLHYKTIVGVDYSANYIGNESVIHAINNASGIFFVNYLIELDRFSVESHNNEYITRLLVNGKVSDFRGHTIFQFERAVSINLNPTQLSEIRWQKYAIEDIFPLTEGNYQLDILIKNEASKEFTSVEKNIDIPDLSCLQMSNLVLAYRAEQDSSGTIKAFKVGDVQLFPSTRNDFCVQDDLIIFLQIFGLDNDLKQHGSLKYVISRDEKEIKTVHNELRKYQNRDFFLENFSLKAIPPGYYIIRASLLDEAKKEILFRESRFTVSPAPALPRPWISSIVHTSPENPAYLSMLSNQLLNKGETEKAKILAKKAYHLNPASLNLALSLSNILFILEDHKSLVEILTPFYLDKKYEVLELLAISTHALGEFDKAISYYREHLSHYGLSFYILSFLGECYYRTGNKQEALKAWEKSLELNPSQEEIKKKVDILRK